MVSQLDHGRGENVGPLASSRQVFTGETSLDQKSLRQRVARDTFDVEDGGSITYLRLPFRTSRRTYKKSR